MDSWGSDHSINLRSYFNISTANLGILSHLADVNFQAEKWRRLNDFYPTPMIAVSLMKHKKMIISFQIIFFKVWSQANRDSIMSLIIIRSLKVVKTQKMCYGMLIFTNELVTLSVIRSQNLWNICNVVIYSPIFSGMIIC